MPTSSTRGAHAPLPEPDVPIFSPRPVTQLPEQGPRRSRWVGAAILLLLASCAWFWLRQPFPAKPKPEAAAPAVRTARARRATLEQTLRVAGSTAAGKFMMLLAPQMRGTRGHGAFDFMLVLQRLVHPGAIVKRGDVVAEFDRMYQLLRLADYQASAIQHENNLRRLKANREVKRVAHEQLVARAKANFEKAALELKRSPVLSDIKAEKNRLTYEEAQATYRQLSSEEEWVMASESAAVHASELDLRVSRMELERAQRNADRMIVKAPIDGMVVMMTLRRGGENSQIQEGDQIWPGQPYMQIVDRGSMVVDTMVNQVDAQRVRLGMAARVRFDAFPDLEVPAEVTAVGGSAQSKGWRGSWVRSVPVRLRLEETEERVIPDLSVSADLVLDKAEDAVVIPREAVFAGAGGEPFAYVRGQSGWEKHPLELGLSNNTSIAVISGVEPGEVVAASLPSEETPAETSH